MKSKMTESFLLNVGGQPVWKAIVDGVMISADFNTKGAADAGIDVERRRRAKKKDKTGRTGVKSLTLALLMLLASTLAHAQDWPLQYAAGLLEAQGYRPDARWEMRVSGIWGPLPADYPNGPDVTDVTIWRWEDNNPDIGTGIIHMREQANGATRTMLVQMDISGHVVSLLPIVGFDFRAHAIKKVEEKPADDPAPEPPKKSGPVKGWGWEPQNANLANFYLCSYVGCGGAALVTFLFGPVIGVGGFAPACTGILIGCSLKGLFFGF